MLARADELIVATVPPLEFGRHRRGGRQRGRSQPLNHIAADEPGNLEEGLAVAGIDHHSVAAALFREISHFGQAAHHCSAVPAKYKGTLEEGLVVQPISGDPAQSRRRQRLRSFHALDGWAVEQLRAVQAAPLQVEPQVIGHIPGRGIDGARTPVSKVRVRIRRDTVGPIQLGQPLLYRRGIEVARCIHVQRFEKPLGHVILEALAGNPLDDRRQHGGSGVAVSHPGARAPPRDARRRAEGQRIRQRDRRRMIVRVLAQVNVVKTGGMLHQMLQPHGLGRLPGINESHLGRPVSHRICQLEFAFLMQLQRRQSRERFRHRPDAKESFGGYG